MKKYLLLILIILCITTSLVLGQQHFSRNYTINDGLPGNSIHDIYKDSKGFLWLGTDAGLAQFDGKEFKVLSTNEGLAGNQIWSIVEDSKDQLWVGCHDGGLSRIKNSQIKTYAVDSGLISDKIRTLHYSEKFNILLIGTENGLSVLDNNSFISFHKKLRNVNQHLQITNFIEETDFIYVFTNGNGLYKYMPNIKNLIRIPTDHPLNNQLTNSAYISTSGDTLINYYRKSFLSLNGRKKISQDFIGQIQDYKEDNNNNIWIAAWNNNYINAGGIYKYDSLGLHDFGNKIGVKSKNILSLEFDANENILWIGTKDQGLYLYPLTNFSYCKLDELNISDIRISSQGEVWAISDHNIIKISTNEDYKIIPHKIFKNKFELFTKNKIKQKYQYLNDPNGTYGKYRKLINTGKYPYTNPYLKADGSIIKDKSFYKPLKYDVLINKKLRELNSILEDTEGNIWVGSNVGIFKIESKKENIFFYDLEGYQFNKFFLDKENKLYASSWADLHIYNNINKLTRFITLNYYENDSPINVSKVVSHDDQIWFISKDYGLFIYNNNKFFSSRKQNQNPIKNLDFNDICFDNQGNAIVGTNSGIIYILQFKDNSIHVKNTIDKRDGLSGTSIRHLSCTKDNLLIAGTNAGLNVINLNEVYNLKRIVVVPINKSKGFIDYSGNCSAIKDDKSLWIGSNDNLIKANIDDIRVNESSYINFYLKTISTNNKDIDLDDINSKDLKTNIPTENLHFNYYNNSISFVFDHITYLDPENIHFSYKLDGLNNNWAQGPKDHKLIFQNLKPGKYRLRIKVFRTNKYKPNQELSISFTISSPLWLRWWFIALAAVCIVLIVWSLILLRTKNIKNKERIRTEIAERISEFEMKALRAQMNPHFIFNVINSIQNYMLDEDIDAALNYLSEFAKLIRLTLDNVSKKQVTLDDELSYIKYYLSLEQMRFGKKFETDIILPPEFESSRILIPSMILQPFIENSIKHGFAFKDEGGEIKLEFLITENNILKCIIEDNGIGRKKSRELNKSQKGHQSKGTFITNERLSLLNQTKQRKGYKFETIDLYDDFDNACGTRVEIFIPI